MTNAGAAVFDLDGTIAHGDTCAAFLRWALRRRPGGPRRVAAAALGLLAGRDGYGRAALKQAALAAAMGGSAPAETEALAEAFVGLCLSSMVKPEALRRIERHRAEGDLLVLATAGIDIYAEPLGARLGFDHVLSSRAARAADGRLTGRLAAGNLRGEAKAASVRALLAAAPGADGPVTAYSDHHADLPLLLLADHGVAVDPTARLARLAPRLGLHIERWTG